jgi:DNA-binding SARP family transcriptional activator/dipeptidyl aminopeptidase/acylaminoacyl peptidase
LALLAYLAVRNEARRDELVDLLWGEVNEVNARNAFRQALHRLRTALGERAIPQDPDRVQLARQDVVSIDRDDFVNAIERGDIFGAVDLYRGDFLEGFEIGEPVFDSWVDAERTRLKGRFQSALQRGAESALGTGRWLEALQYVQRLTSLAPYDESAALLEANVLVSAGRTVEAMTTLRRFSQVLRDQLDLAPSAKVREMLARIERADANREPSPARAKETPFVGREGEIARLMGLLRGLAAEQGATLYLEGPVGIGKSRLMSEFVGRARSVGPLLVLRGRERPVGATLPYACVAEALRGALKAPGVAGTGRHLLAEASRILPELRDSFDLPDPGPVEAEGGRLRFFEGIAALLDSAAYEQPVCVVLDDMHHASAATLELISYLSGRLHGSPVLILLAYRSDVEQSAIHRARLDADRRESLENITLSLGALDQGVVRELVGGIAGPSGADGQLDVDGVAGAAHGNPMRAVELTRRALNGEPLPSTVVSLRDILWARLQQASPSQRRVFFASALLPRASSLRLLASAAHLPELATLEAAQELEALGLITQQGDLYAVAHDFTTAFVAELSGLAGRALLAGWAADALAAEPAPPAADLANLYSVAGQQGASFVHARRAVYDAAAIGSAIEVNRMLSLALTLAPDAKSREQIESMQALFGTGKRLIEAAPPERNASPATETAAAQTRGAPTPATESAGSGARRPVLTLRLLGLVIVGTLAISLAVAWSQSLRAANGPRALRDSLLVSERGNDRPGNVFVVSGSIDDASRRGLGVLRRDELPAWTQSLQLPWIRPSVSPSGIVAAERMTETGTDVYLVRERGSEPIPVAVGPGTDAILGWAPDGEGLLIRRSRALADGSFDADLWAYRIVDGKPAPGVAIDTSSARSVEDEAVWSPDGSRIAWVAQSGNGHQRDVFLSRADGSKVENITSNPAEDYHIAWSSDGNLLAFTSDRDGNPDLFAVEFEGGSRRLWRLTNTPGEEDYASFSPDHRFVAFQSTAGGDAAVYVMPSLGGVPVRVTPSGGQFSIAGWRGRPEEAYVDRVRIIGPTTGAVGDSISISLFSSDRDGNTRLPESVDVRLLDPAAAELRSPNPSGGSSRYTIVPRRDGAVRVVASVPGWREDTLTVRVGGVVDSALDDDFASGVAEDRWMVLGSPRPTTRSLNGAAALFPQADLQWPSGILSRGLVSLADSIDIEATFVAPFAGRPIAGASLTMGLVGDAVAIDSAAPQVLPFVAMSWDGEASRLSYSVGPQSKSDPVSVIGADTRHRMRLVVSRAGAVSFFVDSRLRWTSSLRFLGAGADSRARLWLGGRATGDWGAIQSLVVHRP